VQRYIIQRRSCSDAIGVSILTFVGLMGYSQDVIDTIVGEFGRTTRVRKNLEERGLSASIPKQYLTMWGVLQGTLEPLSRTA
jgi:ABC-type dipeptide/oligopeptide/nickel transport system permease component